MITIKNELNKAVAKGELTTAQKHKILQKRAQTKNKLHHIRHFRLKIARQLAIKQLIIDIKLWVQDNQIPLRWLSACGQM